MKKSTRSRDFNKKLVVYSATAGAAIALAPAVAKASIFDITTFSYDSGASFTTTSPDDKTASATVPFRFLAANASHQVGFAGDFALNTIGRTTIRIGGATSNKIATSVSGLLRLAKKFNLGSAIENHPFNVTGLLAERVPVFPQPVRYGNFCPSGASAAKSGYVGFERQAGGHTYYGWLRVKVKNNSSGLPREVLLVDHNGDGIYGAWGSKSDNIKAGEVTPVPEPSVEAISGLGLLALGAAGVRELRRRRKAEAEI